MLECVFDAINRNVAEVRLEAVEVKLTRSDVLVVDLVFDQLPKVVEGGGVVVGGKIDGGLEIVNVVFMVIYLGVPRHIGGEYNMGVGIQF